MSKPSKPTLWSEDKPNVTTIIPELAEEIGLNESLVLRQIVFWINISDNLRDDEWWTYQSLSDMKEKAFPYFSVSTLSRTVNKLVEKGLINKTDKYNKRKNDRTTWYSINYEGVRQLKSVKLVLQNEKSPKASNDGILQNEKTMLHIEKPMLQNETTLPDYNPDYKQQTTTPLPPSQDEDEKVTPLPVVEVDEDYKVVFEKLQSTAILTTPTLRDLFKSDFDDYSKEIWLDGIERLIEQRNRPKSRINKPYSYLMGIIRGIAETQQVQDDITEQAKKRTDQEHDKVLKDYIEQQKRIAMLKAEQLGETA